MVAVVGRLQRRLGALDCVLGLGRGERQFSRLLRCPGRLRLSGERVDVGDGALESLHGAPKRVEHGGVFAGVHGAARPLCDTDHGSDALQRVLEVLVAGVDDVVGTLGVYDPCELPSRACGQR